jgi:hypothetical protein
MAELITGDNTKGIKSVGELALRISRFDCYRLFTLYENVRERKVMNLSGNQKFYLVFRSPKKEIRIPEYDTMGFFKVDKVNGCILFKITKKNAEDILSMKTSGEKIFHIIRVYEERDSFGKVLRTTDEVEVYNGKWGDDSAFSTFTTENKVDLLTKALATQVEKNANQLNEYKDLFDKYNSEIKKNSDLEKELEAMRAERDSLESQLNEYVGNTYDGTILSTDTKYIAFENTLDNISFTDEQFSNAINELMTKGEVDMTKVDIDDPRIKLKVNIYDNVIQDLKITVYRNDISIGSVMYDQGYGLQKIVEANDGDTFKFVCTGATGNVERKLYLVYEPINEEDYGSAIKISASPVVVGGSVKESIITCNINYTGIDAVGNIGTLTCYVQ